MLALAVALNWITFPAGQQPAAIVVVHRDGARIVSIEVNPPPGVPVFINGKEYKP
jgi:hypothetical protein